MKTGNRTFGGAVVGAVLPAVFGITMAGEAPEVSHDGLHRIPDAKVALAYIRPNADFSGYDKFLILEPYVAFKKNWEQDHRSVGGHRVTKKDMQDIKKRTAEVFMEMFTETLGEGGFAIVSEADHDVLLLKPAIIDLDVVSRDPNSPRGARLYATHAGAATLYLELYDSVTGQILARAVDRKATRESINFDHGSRVQNKQEARRVMGKWATTLREGFNEIRAR